MTPEQMQTAYALPVTNNYLGETTVRGYLKALLLQLWEQGESFSGKRPFGDSGWHSELTNALMDSGLYAHWDDASEDLVELIKGL